MARACIENVNDWMPAFLEKLRTDGKITRWEWAGGPTLCFEFSGHIQIDITDFHNAVPDYMLRSETSYERLRSIFKRHVILKIVNTLKGGIVHGFDDTWIELEATDKTELIGFRVTAEEKRRLQKEAEKQGLSLSQYIRKKLGLEP